MNNRTDKSASESPTNEFDPKYEETKNKMEKGADESLKKE